VESANIERGEGETTLGLFFPNDPEKKLEVIWENPETKSKPLYVLIRGRHRTIWKTKTGFPLAHRLRKLKESTVSRLPLQGLAGTVREQYMILMGANCAAAGYCQEFDEHGNYKKKRIYIAVEAEVDFNDKGFIRLLSSGSGRP